MLPDGSVSRISSEAAPKKENAQQTASGKFGFLIQIHNVPFLSDESYIDRADFTSKTEVRQSLLKFLF